MKSALLRRAALVSLLSCLSSLPVRAQPNSQARRSSQLPSQLQLEATLRDAVAGSCPGRRVALDPDLTRAAQAFARAVREDRAPQSGSALGFFASLESSEPSPAAGVARVAPPASADRAVGDLFPKTCRFDKAGVAAALLAGGQAVVAVLTAQAAIKLKPIPGRVAKGTVLELSGTLATGLSSPRLFLLQPDGEVVEAKLSIRGNRLSARVRLVTRGEHSIEVLAEGAGGPQVTALRRVFVGVAVPRSPPPERSATGGSGLTAVEVAIDRLRAAHGLPRLARDPALDAVAEGHSRAMAKDQVFAHVLKSDGSVADRLNKSGYAYRSAGENIGLSETAASAHEAVANSPAHLANLLDPRHTRLGLGAVEGTSPEGSQAVYLTEVLAQPIIGAKDPEGDIVRTLARERQRQGLPGLDSDPGLMRLAQREIRALALSGQPLAAESRTAQKALQANSALESAVAELLVRSSPDEAAASQSLRDARWTKLGVGAIYASSAAYGPGRLWMLLLYGR